MKSSTVLTKNEIEKINQTGVISRPEARTLAKYCLDVIDQISRLEIKIEELQGGKTVTLVPPDYERKHARIQPYTDHNGLIRSGNRNMDTLGQLLTENVGHGNFSYYDKLTGPEKHLRKFLEINRLISDLLQDAYNYGLRDGKSLLIGLNNGTVALKDLQ